MSDPNYNRDQMINSNFEALRQLRADHDDLKVRVEALVTKMEEFRTTAMELLTEMSQAHAPKSNTEERTNGRS